MSKVLEDYKEVENEYPNGIVQVIIDETDNDPVYGISFNGGNPNRDDYFQLTSYNECVGLSNKINKLINK
tara:strand:+ start:435 stop:644 length:210 start_codon:yes stop_codon:yes gene_type:complete